MFTNLKRGNGRCWFITPVMAVSLLLVLVFSASAAPNGAATGSTALASANTGHIELVGQIGGGANSVSVAEDYAYVVDCVSGLYIIDIANPETPTVVGSYDTPGCASGVTVAGDYAYVGDGSSGLLVIDITNPADPFETGHVDMPSYCCGMAVVGHYLYAGNAISGLRVIDITNPAAPFEIGFIDTPDWAHSVAVNGDYAYVADGQDLRVIDITNPAAPSEAGFVDTPGFARDVDVAGSYAYVADGWGGLRVFDLTNPAAPAEAGFIEMLGYATGLALGGDFAYVTDFFGDFNVINVADAATPFKVANYETPGSGLGTAVSRDYIYVADGDAGLLILQFTPGACPAVPGNLLQNYCFEDGPGPWTFWTDGAGTYLTSSANPYQGQFAADVAVAQAGSNVQFYQKDIALKPNTKYELSFAAYSSNGNNLGVYLQQHGAPYTNYGLNNVVVDLTTGWKVYRTTFTTTGFAAPVKDARLRFWLAPYDANGMRYHIDWAVLREVDVANPPIPPDPPVIVPPPGQCKPPHPANLIHNPGFESGKTSWTFVTDGTGSFTTANTGPYECANNARVSISNQGTNVQLYQQNVALLGGKTYQLRLAARSSGGQDVQLFLHKHDAPYNNYGLNGVTLDLTPAWTVFVVEFTAAGSVPLTDGRLRLWLGPFDQNGATFEFDDVVLLPKSAVTAQGEQVAAGSNGRERMTARGVAAVSHLTQGYFLEGDEDGRLAGAHVPDNGSSFCYNARPSLSRLLPANGKVAKVAILGSGRPQNVVITAITQNEPVGAEPDGSGLGTPWAMLRRERDADGEGRVYHVAFTASDQGRSCSHEVVVTVPVDQHAPVMDSGATYDAMVATE